MTRNSEYATMPFREILHRAEQVLRITPNGPQVGMIPRDQLARGIRDALALLEPGNEERWTPLEPAAVRDMTGNAEYVQRLAESTGYTEEQVIAELRRALEDEFYRNNLYQVAVRRIEGTAGSPGMIHLSIKRLDQNPVRDWRHLQRIKNELVGEEYEGVELYPAESRLADSANQYHVWVVDDPSFRWGFGFGDRLVSNKARDGTGAVQRPMDAAE